MAVIVDVVIAVVACIAAPLIAIFHRPHVKWSYKEALLHRVLSHFTPSDIPVLRFGFEIFGRLQRLVFPPSSTVNTPTVKGLWYGDLSTSLSDAVVILFVHGGGFVSGTADGMAAGLFQPLLQTLQLSARGVRLFSVEYDLSPENPYPGPVNQAFDAYRWLLGQGIAASNIVVMGDSVGGNAVLSLMQRAGRESVAMPACGVLISPLVDLTIASPSYEASTDIFTKATVANWRNLYLNNDLTKITEASPGLQSLDGLPPLMVLYGQAELMADDIAAFVAKAKQSRVQVTEFLHPHLYHDFVLLSLGQASQDAIAAIGQFVMSKM